MRHSLSAQNCSPSFQQEHLSSLTNRVQHLEDSVKRHFLWQRGNAPKWKKITCKRKFYTDLSWETVAGHSLNFHWWRQVVYLVHFLQHTVQATFCFNSTSAELLTWTSIPAPRCYSASKGEARRSHGGETKHVAKWKKPVKGMRPVQFHLEGSLEKGTREQWPGGNGGELHAEHSGGGDPSHKCNVTHYTFMENPDPINTAEAVNGCLSPFSFPSYEPGIFKASQQKPHFQ